MSATNILLILAISVSIGSSIAYIPTYYPSYQQYGLRRNYFNALPYGYKRGPPLDRLSMGFIKRADEMPEEIPPSDEESTEALKHFLNILDNERNNFEFDRARSSNLDSVSSGFLRKKRSADTEDVSGDPTLNKIVETDAKENSDKMNVEKRYLDRISSGFVKKGLDRLSSGFVKKDLGDIEADKRRLDRMSSGFIKKRPFDRLNSGFVKKNDENDIDQEKRYFDRLSSNFIKKDDIYENNKRRLDRLQNGFVKKSESLADDGQRYVITGGDFKETNDEIENEKRYFDRLNSGFVKKGLDRLSSGFVKKNDFDEDKRALDRLSMGFVKKDITGEKRALDRVSSGFIKKDKQIEDDIDSVDKRRLDRVNSGFIKKDIPLDEDIDLVNKKSLDRISSGFVKKDDEANDDKRNLDRLSMGFVKKNEKAGLYDNNALALNLADETIDDMDAEKRRLDRVSSGFIKKSYGNTGDKRALDRLSSGFVKRRLDRLSSGFVKKSDIYSDGDYIDNDLDKRYLDRLNSGFVRRGFNDSPDDERQTSYAVYQRKRRSPWNEEGRFDRLGYGLIKRRYETDDRDYDMFYPYSVLSKRYLSRLNGLIK